ncbi:hypothetical protein VTO73DRAFT_4167 [Trametes versicolor]
MAPTSTRRKIHPSKRRKLAHAESSVLSLSASHKPPNDIELPICASCRRSFTGSRRNQLVQCARCHEPTCTICSRTCNGCPPSVPPTPALTRTASPSSTPPTPLLSPHQPTSELGMDIASTQDRAAPSIVTGRRRKVRDLDQEDEVSSAGQAGYEGMEGAGEVLPGCGRTVCQKCAFETPESDLTTCFDCATWYAASD